MTPHAEQCLAVREALSAFLDGALSPEETRQVAVHLETCRPCGARVRDMTVVRRTLRSLPMRQMPAALTTSLRVLASHDRSRRLSQLTWRSRWEAWRGHARLLRDNLMRPFALPFAGGLVSALLLFAALLPNYPMRSVYAANDVPLPGVHTDLEVRATSMFDFGTEEVYVDLLIDEQGRIASHCFPKGQPALRDPAVRRNIENALLFTEFTPATSLGHPLAGRIRVTFRRSRIDVRG